MLAFVDLKEGPFFPGPRRIIPTSFIYKFLELSLRFLRNTWYCPSSTFQGMSRGRKPVPSISNMSHDRVGFQRQSSPRSGNFSTGKSSAMSEVAHTCTKRTSRYINVSMYKHLNTGSYTGSYSTVARNGGSKPASDRREFVPCLTTPTTPLPPPYTLHFPPQAIRGRPGNNIICSRWNGEDIYASQAKQFVMYFTTEDWWIWV